jgi:hypothetical protein
LGGALLRDFWLQPNHMVFVISLQRVTLPRDVTGVATLVTALTKDGILCLNTGVIDPGYDGHLGATLVNFSNKPRKISVEQRLFRILFIDHAPISDRNFRPVRVEKSDYVSDSLSKGRTEFSDTFLDVKGFLGLAREHAWSVVGAAIFTNWIPVLALIISVISIVYQFSTGSPDQP